MAAAMTATEAPDLVVVSGRRAGLRIPLLPGHHLLGRAPPAAILLTDPGISRAHAELVVTPDGRCAIQDLGSTNGTLLNGMVLGPQRHPLTAGDHIHLGRAVVLRVQSPSSSHEDEGEDASFDPITGIYDRRCLAARADRAVNRARRQGLPVALCLLDIEQLSVINADHGVDVGDEALRTLAHQLRAPQVAGEVLARFEDDMFVLLVPGTDRQRLAARVQRALHGLHVTRPDGTTVLVRVSAGVSDTRQDRLTSAVDLFLVADQRLRQLKRTQPGGVRQED